MAGGFDYLDEGKSQGGINKKKLSNLQTDQTGLEESPAEGGEGYVGGNPNASTMGFDYVTGKKGYSTDKPIWSQQSSMMGVTDNTGSQDGDESFGGQDSTDEKASYKKVQMDEGLPQTYRRSAGAGDAGPSGSDEPDGEGLGVNQVNPDTQTIGSEMPQTEFTHESGGGAPLFKH